MDEESRRQVRSCVVELALEAVALADMIEDRRVSEAAAALAEKAGESIGFSKPVLALMRTSTGCDVRQSWQGLAPSGRASYAKKAKRRLVIVPVDYARRRRQ